MTAPAAQGTLEVRPASLRCADQFAALDASPVGSVAAFEAMLAIELALPWPSDVSADPRLGVIAEMCRETGHRLQAVVPRGDTPEGMCTMVRFTRADGTTGFHRGERIAAIADRDDAAAALLAEPVASGRAEQRVTDVFICAHGSRDRCCGGSGTALHQRVVDSLGDQVVVWRTSHLGGHRFAPTALTMPDGHAWSHLDAVVLAGIVDRAIPTRSLAGLDRGTAALDDRWQQAADAALLQSQGWGWVACSRRMWTEPTSDDDRRLVHVETDDGASWTVEVRAVRAVPVPLCGEPLDHATKSDSELEIVSVTAASAAAHEPDVVVPGG